MNTPGLAVILSGPSGAGKSTICQKVFATLPTARFSVSCTTREPREGEINGVHYHFLSQDEFIRRRDNGDFLEWANVHGNFYGTLKDAVFPFLKDGCQIILDIDVQGARQVWASLADSPLRRHFLSVFCAPVSLAVLEQRLRNRGTETEETLSRRLKNAAGEMACWRDYDYLVINEDREQAADEFLAIIRAASLKTELTGQAPWEN